MTIVDNRQKTPFSSLRAGDVFIYDETIYIKVRVFDSENINAVSVENGEPNCFFESTLVQRVDAKLVIE